MRVMMSVDEVALAIAAGKRLLLAGDEALLRKLPRGTWVGGTIPYFMGDEGGLFSRERLACTELPGSVTEVRLRSYSAPELESMTADAPSNGISFIIIPAASEAHLSFAQHAPSYPDIFLKPFAGWIAGVALEDLGKQSAKVVNGQTGEISDSKAVVMHATLPAGKLAKLSIINVFKPGAGEDIEFDETGFSIRECRVGGKRVDFAKYLLERQADTRLPLVADYSGSMINTSFQSVDRSSGVQLYAPVFRGVRYRLAAPVSDYVAELDRASSGAAETVAFSCNCILNYVHGRLEGKRTGAFKGPFTFGEIAFQLLNQTLMKVEIVDA
ncbi:MAG: hypothetical protein HY901_35855 [Deltaproteobacteria bacterium]|nr:hypothetical protein [Deltaproteobacteria bacterium]